MEGVAFGWTKARRGHSRCARLGAIDLALACTLPIEEKYVKKLGLLSSALLIFGADAALAATKWSTIEVSRAGVKIISGDRNLSATARRQSSSTNVELKFKRAVKWYQLMIGGAAGEIDCSLVEWRTPQMTDDRRKVMFEIFEGLSSCSREVYVEWVE